MKSAMFAVIALACNAACASAPPVMGFEQASTAAGIDKINRLAIAGASLAAPTPPQNSTELMHALGYLSSHRAALFDANHDGRYGFVEWLASDFSVYVLYNAAKDGRVTEEEFVQERCGPNAQPFMSCGLAGAPIMGSSRKQAHKEFEHLDHGHKGYLVAADVEGEALAYFRGNDVNGDGYVTEAEIAFVATRNRRR